MAVHVAVGGAGGGMRVDPDVRRASVNDQEQHRHLVAGLRQEMLSHGGVDERLVAAMRALQQEARLRVFCRQSCAQP